jgi:hypothetical protein
MLFLLDCRFAPPFGLTSPAESFKRQRRRPSARQAAQRAARGARVAVSRTYDDRHHRGRARLPQLDARSSAGSGVPTQRRGGKGASPRHPPPATAAGSRFTPGRVWFNLEGPRRRERRYAQNTATPIALVPRPRVDSRPCAASTVDRRARRQRSGDGSDDSDGGAGGGSGGGGSTWRWRRNGSSAAQPPRWQRPAARRNRREMQRSTVGAAVARQLDAAQPRHDGGTTVSQ